ncbi:acyl-CoA/acyl-ACP dehydrogenase [Reyranella sp. MMS21-HV4-11]|jgi:alkylation response protein AidB-like acyl-CoA dehydrogenase|uniref:Acyl-CoA/acyl-ACP dehydrogenase n=1 Tax=Reyranella humidisoli TaxID=2849149 RepID=A0ABS6IEP4_9HYPH|nr:acyl-CoA dehydrogenase family protein [Reyranella sp. MMS21-HV4-11]MBU8872284.1 acyl-CoA/acyl-ACP dehydrogenase [Reyranella sp. MMS21-HV4-11]
MNFDFSDDQKLLKEQVRKFLADKCPTKVVRRVLDGSETHAEDVWKGLVDLGVPALGIPETYGGMGLSPLEVCVVAEEIGRAAAPVPFDSSVVLATEALKLAGSDAQKKKWLPELASGKAIGTLAIAEGAQPPKPRNIRTMFGGGRLNGKKLPVTDGEAATFAIALANTGGSGDRAVSLVIVDLTQKAVAKKRIETIDPARKHAELTFTDASAELLGAEGEGWSLLERLYDAAAVYFAFAQVGGAEAAMWMARDYALQRNAFGRAIGSYQAIKHKLADCYVKLELARSNAYYGAMMLTEGGADLPLAAAAARIAATEAYDFAAKENIQTHGGIGFTWEADTQFHYRRSRLLALSIGGPMAWKDKLVTRLEQKNAA